MTNFTEMQKASIAFFKKNLPEWLNDELKKDKYVVIYDKSVMGIFDTIDFAVDYAYENLDVGSYIIQQIVDESETVSFLRLAVV